MSTNGVNTTEDTDMAECDGEKVVTMMDVLQEQQDFEEDANAVLGASDDKNCTYSKGYIKRQAIYACMTCCPDVKQDDTKRAGVCLACSLSCHENHELIELYTKRNFRCDCGNPKFNSHPCQLNPNKNDINEDNKYNQNYSGLYCICHRPYPDPEAKVEDEMIQCIICEDWLHASHLDATVPSNDQYSEMICKGCMEKNAFLHDYSGFAVAVENSDVDVVSSHDVTISNGHTSDSVLETCEENAEQNMSVEDVEVNDKTGDYMKDNTNDETSSITISEPESITNNAGVEQTKMESVSDMVINTENETNDNNDTQSPTKINNTEEINMSINDLNDTPQEVTEKLDPNNSQELAKINENPNKVSDTSTMRNKSEVKDTDNTNLLLDQNESNSKMDEENLLNGEDKLVNEEEKLVNEEEKLVNEEEKLVNKEEKRVNEEEIVLNKEETSNHTAALDDVEMKPIEKSEESTVGNTKHEAIGTNTEISTQQPKDEITNTTEEEPKDELTNNTEEKTQEELARTMQKVPEDELTSSTKEEPKDKSVVSTESDNNDSNTNTDETTTISSTTEADVKDTGPENSKLSNEGEIVNTSATDLDSTNIANDNKNKNHSTHSSDITEENNSIAKDIPSKMDNITEENDSKNKDEVSKPESMAEESEMQEEKLIAYKTEENEDDAKQNDHSDIENKVPNEVVTNTNENKRKLSMDEEKDNVATKKVKTDQEKSCVRPKYGKKHFKGATFWPSSFRQKLCTCNECLAMYKDLSVLFLIDPEDTVSAYEMLGKEKTEGSPSSQYEKGLQALSSLDRIQQINALTEYNKMRDKLLDFLKSFKDRREIVKEEDIKGFFAGMKPKREPDGVYFCR